jgi:putative hydrolase of HD superfamily
MDVQRLNRQIQFIIEIDKLKDILRRSYLVNGQRRENSAEHSWHIAMMAILLAEYANEQVDLLRVIKMLLVHDIVEIDAGDTYIYSEADLLSQAARERQAADRLFGLLPADQAGALRELWQEFEARTTAEARFAAALDRLMPLLHAYNARGKSWKEGGVTSDMVIARNSPMADGSTQLWQFARSLIEDAVAKGYLATPDSVNKP